MSATTLTEEKHSYDHLEKISAIIDGELNDFTDEELDVLLTELSEDDDLRDMWQTSYVMKDLLTEDQTSIPNTDNFFKKFSEAFAEEPIIVAPSVSTHSSSETKTSAKVLSFQDAKQKQQEQLQSKTELSKIEQNKKHPMWSLALAASVALMTVSGFMFKSNEESTVPLPITASTHNLQSIEQNMNHQLVSMTENIKQANEQELKNKDLTQASSIYLPQDEKNKASSFQKATYDDQ